MSHNHQFRVAYSYDDVLLVPKYSEIESRSNVDLTTQISPNVKLKLPLASINMSDVTGVEMAITLGLLGGIGFIPRFVSPEEQADMVAKVKAKKVVVGAALGIKEGFVQRAELLVAAGVDILTIDIAHGHMQKCLEATQFLKNKYGSKVGVISGVIGTYEGAADLYKNGADAVRVGVGPGTICTTRIQTGVGMPQITGVMDAKRAAIKYKKWVLCDGGTKSSGDIVKGLAAGASCVVIGSQFAGTKEAPGKLIVKAGKKYKAYNASTSLAEKLKHTKKLSDTDANYIKHIEGVESMVPYKGELKDVVTRMEANIKSGYSYCGAKNISELWKKAEFIHVTSSGVKENGHHSVIAKEI
jgi:IMP dehydrogenase